MMKNNFYKKQKFKIPQWISALSLCWLLSMSSLQAQEVYVKVGGTGTGADWSNASNLQNALAGAGSDTKIYVAAGTYYPSIGVDFDDPANGIQAREVTFQIPDGVEVYGGFAGTETGTIDLSARDLLTNVTILSGDIGTTGDNSDNAYHIVYTKNVTNATIVDGFTITAGNADGGFNPNNAGGGWYNDGSGTGNTSNPTLRNITFSSNTANSVGGGMYNNGSGGTSSPSLTNCTFTSNTANSVGGGMYNNGSGGTSIVILFTM